MDLFMPGNQLIMYGQQPPNMPGMGMGFGGMPGMGGPGMGGPQMGKMGGY